MSRKLRAREKRRYTEEFVDEEIEECRKFSVEEKLISDRFDKAFVKEMKGEEFNFRYIQEHGFDCPVVIKEKKGLGLKVPDKTFSVCDVKQCVGSRRVLDVMDVFTQKDFEMTMKEWCQYYENPVRDRLLNVISLEFSHTKLETMIESPNIVRQVDWVDWIWPRHLKLMQTEASNSIADMKYPKVQKYCLMSVKGCYTDFHIDFGGTSVWYHILKGQKVFWLIPPTEKNIQLYEQWVLSGKQTDIFFGDTVEQCARIRLYDGYTFFIPTGWIHAVYTSEDSLVFGGNFLHSFAIEQQLRIAQVEDITKVPVKFRYPFYQEMLWYVLHRYVLCLTGVSNLTVDNEGNPIENDQNSKLTSTNHPASHSTHKNKNTSNGNFHLTSYELNGLKAIINWLERLSCSKRSVPELIKDSEALLSDAKSLVENHSNDDHRLAITGKPILFWNSKGNKPSVQSSSNSVNTTQSANSPTTNVSSTANSSTPSSGLSVTAQLRQIKNTSFMSSLNYSSPISSNTGDSIKRPESPPTRPLSSNQYSVGINSLTKSFDQIPHSFTKLIATTGVGNQSRISMGFTPISMSGSSTTTITTLQSLPNIPPSSDSSPSLFEPFKHNTTTNFSDPIKTLSQDPTSKDCKTMSNQHQDLIKNSSANDSAARRRRTRCKKCDACLRADCGDCHFCRDMKKFGGPGRMKQSCIARQCLAPVLPHTACCIICGRDGWEKMTPVIGDSEAQSSLLECSKCWEIVHPVCLKEKNPEINFDGIMSDELPNSWECPKCIASTKFLGPNLKVNCSSNLNSSPNQSIKPFVSTASISNLAKISNEKKDIYDFQTCNVLPETVSKKAKTDGPSIKKETTGLATGDNEKSDDSENPSDAVNTNVTISKASCGRSDTPVSSQSSSASKSGDSHVRSCARFPLLQEAIKQQQADKTVSSKAKSNNTSKAARNNKKHSETARDRLFKSLKGLKKRSISMSSYNGLASGKKSFSKSANTSTSSPSPTAIQLCNSSENGKSLMVSNLTSNKQPEKSPNLNGGEINGENIINESIYDEETDNEVDMAENSQDESNDFMEDDDAHGGHSGNKLDDTSKKALNIIRPKYVVRPAPLTDDLSDTEEDDEETEEDDMSDDDSERNKAKKKLFRKFSQRIDGNLSQNRDVILPILRYLPTLDLLNCMRVCRKWNTWCVDPILWKTIDLTRKRITYYVLIGIVRRQPLHLNLGWSNISKKQLGWLIARLPQLQSLVLSGCSATTISALSSCNCPFIKKLDLSWVDSLNDNLIKDLLAPPTDTRPGLLETKTRLKHLTEVNLAGTDITDMSIRLLSNNLPHLTKVDLSSCPKVTDMGIGFLAAAKATKLAWLNLSSCPNISDTSLESLKRCRSLSHLDMRHCSQVNMNSCQKFIATSLAKEKLALDGEKMFKLAPPPKRRR